MRTAQFEEPLVKSKPLSLGSWGGVPVIAIGPKGGKIIGYKSGGRPIYAGSTEAKKLVSRKKITEESVIEWLVGLGIPAKSALGGIAVSEASGKLIEKHFKLKPKTVVEGNAYYLTHELGKYQGKPLVPQTASQKASLQAKAAAGELDKDPFPKLGELNHVKTLKSGQHNVELYQDKSGKKWAFKYNDTVISRAEEAAVRISRLLLGSERAAAAKHVTLNGKPGVLIEWIEGEVFNDYNHSDPPTKILQNNLSEIMRHQIVDWVVSNHDSHAGNFLVTKSGKIGGFDKGQAWKFLGKDKLDTSYKPNASKQIYLPFWQRIHNGDIKLTDQDRKDMIAAAEEILNRLDMFSEDQFKSIVGLYASEREKYGADKGKLLKRMWDRVQNTRSDFEQFLSQQFGYTVNLKSKSKDNFETMPESEPDPTKEKVSGELTPKALNDFLLKFPGYEISAAELKYAFKITSAKASAFLLDMYKDGKLDRKKTQAGWWVYFLPKAETKVIEEPDKPEVIEGGAKQPVVEEQVAGWPITKGKDTVFHPGNPPEPDVNWPSGYPGPGYKIQKNYKGEDFTIEFGLEDGKPIFTVYFPNGEKINYQSPNAASDSMVLWNKKLPLDASASDKKNKYKVSYPAFRGLGLKKFAKELAASKTAPVESIMGVAGYSDEEIEKEIPAEEVVTPKSLDPEFGKKLADIGTVPGSVFAYEWDDGQKLYGISRSNGTWRVYTHNGEYFQSKAHYQGFLNSFKNNPENYNFDTFKLFKAEDVSKAINEGVLPKELQPAIENIIGQALEPEKPVEALPKEPPYTPVEVGNTISVKKKFPEGKKEVYLKVLNAGKFEVSFKGAEEWPIQFDSLSAASDHVWLKQKGYESKKAYKEATGKKKIPSGGGWKFWGVKSEDIVKAPIAPEVKPEVAEPKVEWIPLLPGGISTASLKSYPVGTEIELKSADGATLNTYVKTEPDLWESDIFSKTNETLVPNLKDANVVNLKLPEKEEEPLKAPEVKPELPVLAAGFKIWPETDVFLVEGDHQQLLKDAPIGATIKAQPKPNVGVVPPIHYKKVGENSWEDQNTNDIVNSLPISILLKDSSSHKVYSFTAIGKKEEEEEVTLPTPETLPDPKPSKKKKKTKKFTAYGNAKFYTDPHDIADYPKVVDKISFSFEVADKQGWFQSSEEGKIPLGAKSPLWAGWVPPAGLVFEGEFGGKKYFLTTATTGFNFTHNEPLKTIGFAILDSEGKVSSGKSELAATSLKQAAQKLGLPTDLKSLHQIFKLTNSHFLPGETKHTIAKGAGPYPVESLDTAPEDMTATQKEETVKGTWSVHEVMKGKYELLEFKPHATSLDYVTISTKDDSPKAIEQLNELLTDSGLAPGKIVFKGHTGSYVSLTVSEFQKEMTTTMPAFSAASLSPSVSAANWETMPEGYPKTVSPSGYNINSLIDLAEKAPIGAKFYPPNTNSFLKKSGQGKWESFQSNKLISTLTDKQAAKGIQSSSGWETFSVIPPGSEVSDLPELIPEKPVPLPKSIKSDSEKLKKAKELAAWAKEHPAVTNPEHIHLLSYLVNRLDLKDKLYARMLGEHILLGPDELFDDSGLTDIKGMAGAYEIVETPLGRWLSFDVQKLKAALPEAGMMEGPDKESYPLGTTFKTETVITDKEDLIAAEITKYSAHKTDPANKKTLKIAGIDDAKVKKLQEILDKYEIQGAEEIIKGANYTLVGVPKTELNKVGKTETVITPVVPKQPAPFIAKSLPLSEGVQRDGQLATINRGDLGILDTMKLQRSGNWIRCGKWGIFKGNQITVRKVRDANGKYYYEVRGHLFHPSAQTKNHTLKSGNLTAPKTDGTYYDEYSFGQQTYDEVEGCSVETGKGDAYQFPGLGGTTEKGSAIQLATSGKPSIDGSFRIRIAEGEDVETELAEAFQKMGLDPIKAMAEPTDDDNRRYIKHEVLKSQLGVAGHFMGRGYITSEKKMDDEIVKHKLEFKVAAAKVETAFNGKQCVMIDDMDDVEEAGVSFVYMGMSWTDAAVRLVENSGMWSNKTKLLNGIVGNSGSLSMDIASGGVNSVFTRLANKSQSGGWGWKCYGPKMIFKKDVLRRADWYSWTGDAFGSMNANNQQAGNVSKNRKESYKNKGDNNEVNFEDGLSFQHLAGVTVNNDSEKTVMVNYLKGQGVTEFNGIPLEDFIVNINNTTDRELVVSKVKGLHEKG